MPVDLSAAVGWTAEYRRESGCAVTYLRREQSATRWALLADTHISADAKVRSGDCGPSTSALAAVEQVRSANLDGVIINGDIAWLEGLPEDYVVADELLGPLAETGPLIAAPGNHDNRGNLCAVFSDPRMDEGAEKVITVTDAGAVRLVCLDSLRRSNVVSGRLEKPQLRWLDGWLSAHDDKPVVLFVHHPLDDPQNGLLDSKDLQHLLRGHEQAKAIFTAHDHVFSHRDEEGLLVVTQPAVGFPFAPTEMHGWLEAEFAAKGVTLKPRLLTNAQATPLRLNWLR